MANFQCFAEELENRIRQEILSEFQDQFESSVSVSTPREVSNETGYQHLGWLMGQHSPLKKPLDYKASPYSRMAKPPRPRKPHSMNAEQGRAFLLLQSYHKDLAPNFNLSELKKAYRQALLSVHPDQGGKAQAFWQVRDAFAALKIIVSK